MPSGAASPQLVCTGSPQSTYPAGVTLDGFICIQRDAKPGQRLWFCHTDGNGGYLWEQLRGFVGVIATPAITASLGITLATNSYTGSVATSQAALGMTARMEPIGADPGLVFLNAWVATAGQINYRITNLSTASTALNGMSFALYLSNPN